MNNTNTLFTGKVLFEFEELTSTNDYAIEMLAKTKPTEGTVISATLQTAGRGQIGSRWLANAGENITMSIILYPTFLMARRQFLLSQFCALAIRDMIAQHVDAAVSIKWPNDIYVHHRKIAGILIQNTLSGQFIQNSVFGMGININQVDFPAELPNATSLAQCTGSVYDLKTVRDQCLACFEQRYLQLKQQKIDLIQSDYLKHLHFLGENTRFENAAGLIFSGTITGTDESGQLLIDTKWGEQAFEPKSIRFLDLF
ncbi:MAG TPA: biotin--[acetyl-CoA-carboxylase] ligase [Saprospiraceae bacterium]|nr:biotin--[acetyl-CoA-carboxylase] ligase [Saprospiraceae bacterium]HMQ83315.1 biotin--[acetyl-CoA-carboxylase] ligase [Saprospiraceae bacterium]